MERVDPAAFLDGVISGAYVFKRVPGDGVVDKYRGAVIQVQTTTARIAV